MSSSSSGGTSELLASGGQSDRELEHALDRLSLSLERIERLLGELRGARESAPGGSPGERAPTGAQAPASDETASAEAEDARVVLGGGPSAFTRR